MFCGRRNSNRHDSDKQENIYMSKVEKGYGRKEQYLINK
jgi:hypothetical protein